MAVLAGCSGNHGAHNEVLAGNDNVREIQVLGAGYSGAQSVEPSQVQIIFYRGATPSIEAKWPAAHVYVDRDFHAALLPNAFTRFCVKPGTHIIEAYLDDAPLYRGKRSPSVQVNLKGGRTYFLRVAENTQGAPVAMRMVDAEKELVSAREQVHALSRASAVEPCKFVEHVDTPASQISHVDNAKVLFQFGRSDYASLLPQSKTALKTLSQVLTAGTSSPGKVVLVGHADPIGNDSSSQRIALKRAITVRDVLLRNGLEANRVQVESKAASEPVVTCSNGSKAELIGCNQPNRRVQIRVE